jgi:hypothetical protein
VFEDGLERSGRLVALTPPTVVFEGAEGPTTLRNALLFCDACGRTRGAEGAWGYLCRSIGGLTLVRTRCEEEDATLSCGRRRARPRSDDN